MSETSSTTIRRAGQICLVAALLGAASGVYLAAVEPAVSESQWSYPQAAGEYRLTQAWFAVQHVGVLLGLLALWWSGAVGTGRLGRVGHLGAVAGMTGLIVTELAAIFAAEISVDSGAAGLIGAAYGLVTLILGLALVAAGVAVVRARVWHGWRRWTPLALGVWVFVPMFPALAVEGDGARLAIGGWMLLFAALGLALARPSKSARVPHEPAAARL